MLVISHMFLVHTVHSADVWLEILPIWYLELLSAVLNILGKMLGMGERHELS